ncbi:MAG TPA: hypothetical protein H9874_02590 [Candidatus Bilophila faecipullorum]|uniref:Uncharacterized protein n=1 Tax=Candidatus Bilophila faecipullorum TaxID=2838482 RepID=A0A9D1QYK7_9BACT|nr:hypothetical protein [uncultured Bilophila sp.]HIW78019.1 hypothetical protein [Candidatus Bilophila faecipullorum]
MKDVFSDKAASCPGEAFSHGGARDGLPADVPRPFVLLDAVSGADAEGLTAWRRFDAAPFWQGMEAAAQAAALHQRFLSGFSRHAFLLSVDECPLPEGLLCDRVEIRAALLGGSLSAVAYRVDLMPHGPAFPGGGGAGAVPSAALTLFLSIGLTPYDATFKRDALESRYRRLFQWLTRNAPSATVSTAG